MSFYLADTLISNNNCFNCKGRSDRWFVLGHSCKECFEKLHSMLGPTLQDKHNQLKKLCHSSTSSNKTAPTQ